jgi:signal transduction histidine kinase
MFTESSPPNPQINARRPRSWLWGLNWHTWSQYSWLKPRRAMCYLDWFLIGVELLLGFLNGAYTYSTEATLVGLGYFVMFAVLAYFIPLQGTLLQRRLYVLINILLLLSTTVVVVTVPTDLIFFFAVVKTCFLLDLPEVILILFLAGGAFVLGNIVSLPLWYGFIEKRGGIEYFLKPENMILSSISSYLSVCVFSVLLSGMILSERRSRNRAEALAREVETLSINLERARISRDLHDSLGHSLTTLGVQLEVAQKLRHQHPEKALQAIDTAKTLADDCLQAVRQSVQTLRPANFSLEKALESLLIKMREVNRFLLKTQISLPLLPIGVQDQVYCMIQEGFTNIQKHAQASYVELQIWHTPDALHLMLKDNRVVCK